MSNTADKPTADRLIDVAGEIFAAKGSSATVREICSAAGCSVAAINYYFGDKQQLYIRCVQAACERKQRLFPFPRPDAEDVDPPTLLRAFLRAMTGRIAAKSNLSWQNTLMLREVLAPSEAIDEMLQSYFRPDFQLLYQLLGRLLGPELDSPSLRRQLATQILARGMFLRTGKHLRTMLEISSEENEDPEKYADELYESILMQVESMRLAKQHPPLASPVDNNAPATPSSRG